MDQQMCFTRSRGHLSIESCFFYKTYEKWAHINGWPRFISNDFVIIDYVLGTFCGEKSGQQLLPGHNGACCGMTWPKLACSLKGLNKYHGESLPNYYLSEHYQYPRCVHEVEFGTDSVYCFSFSLLLVH